MEPIDKDCICPTCKTYSRAYLHHVVTMYPVGCHLLSIHNVAFQLRLMRNIRESIKEDKFPEFVKNFMSNLYPDKNFPNWVVDALKAVNILLE